MPKEREIKFSSLFKAKRSGNTNGRSHKKCLSWFGNPDVLPVDVRRIMLVSVIRMIRIHPLHPQSLLLGFVGFTRSWLWENKLTEEQVFLLVTKRSLCMVHVCLHPLSTEHSGSPFDLSDSAHGLVRPDRKYCPIVEKESETQEVGMEMWGCPEAQTHRASVFNRWENWAN